MNTSYKHNLELMNLRKKYILHITIDIYQKSPQIKIYARQKLSRGDFIVTTCYVCEGLKIDLVGVTSLVV